MQPPGGDRSTEGPASDLSAPPGADARSVPAWTVPGRPDVADSADAAATARWGIPDSMLGLVVWFVVSALFGLVAVVLAATFGDLELTSDTTTEQFKKQAGLELLVATALAGLVGFVGWSWWVSRWKGAGDLRRDFGIVFRWSDLGWGALGGVATVLVALLVGLAWQLFSDSEPPTNTDDILGERHIGPGAALVMVATVGLVVPLAEEVFFRGLLLASLRKRAGVWVALALSSLVFGMLHASSGPDAGEALFVAGVTTAFGLVFGLLRVLLGRLGPAVVAHMVNNTLSVVVVVATQ